MRRTYVALDHGHESHAHLVHPDVVAAGAEAVDDDLRGQRRVYGTVGLLAYPVGRHLHRDWTGFSAPEHEESAGGREGF